MPVAANDRSQGYSRPLAPAAQEHPQGGFRLIMRFNFAVLVAVLAATLVPAAFAARMVEGSARPNPAPTCSSPTLTGPTQARVGETYTVNGCGFAPGSLVPLEVTEAGGCCLALNKVADAEGRFSYTSNVWGAGTYRVRALSRRNNGRWRVAATWSFQAYA
jgi:hypothetical protein